MDIEISFQLLLGESICGDATTLPRNYLLLAIADENFGWQIKFLQSPD